MVTLDQIDRELCEESGYPFSDSQYCPAMIWIQMLGTSLDGMTGGVNPLNLNLKLAEHEHERTAKYTVKERQMLHKFMCGKYQYETWWSHR